jgi:hypothetical protein
MGWSAISKFIMTIDWSTLSDIAVVVTAVFFIWQLSEMRRTTRAQAYGVAREILQDEKVRKARRSVFQLGQEGKPVEEWSEEDIESAEMVCHTYDSVGQMVRHKLLTKNIIVESWGPSLRKAWPILSPLIQKYRTEWNAFEVWDDFEWLANEARKRHDRRKKKHQWLNKLKRLARSFLPGWLFRHKNKGEEQKNTK